VYAIDTRTGRLFWRYHGDSPYGVGPVMGDGRIFAASEGPDGKLTAIALQNGKKRWQARIGDVGAPLALGDSAVYVVTQTGFAIAFRARDGRRLWQRLVGPSRSGPLVVGGRIAIVTLTDTLALLDASTGASVSRTGLTTSTLAPLAAADDSTIVLASPDGAVLAIALPSGRPRWRVATGAPIFGAPAAVGDTVFALTNRCTLWTIPLRAPAAADSAGLGCITVAGPAVVRGGVLVATVAGEVIYFDRAARRTVWTRQIKGELRHPPAIRNGQIIVAPSIGDVVSFR